MKKYLLTLTLFGSGRYCCSTSCLSCYLGQLIDAVTLTLLHTSQVFLSEAMSPVLVHNHQQVPEAQEQQIAESLKSQFSEMN